MGYFNCAPKGSKIVWIVFIIYVCGLFASQVEGQLEEEDFIVDAGQLGKIRGTQSSTAINRRYFLQFNGIPYGKAPFQAKRFLPTEPADTPLAPPGGDGIFLADRPPACCPQTNAYSLCSESQSEDCLGLNVFTPLAPRTSTKKLPVIVFIYGGRFVLGSSSMYTPARLLEDRDVILVTFNYRLGALGFFCLNTEDAPGNAAMYDMVEALKWVKAYIEYFGGDPERITIAGQSSGSAAVSHLMTSPLTRDKGLFHRAIAMSGTSLNDWGTTTSEQAEKSSLEIAAMLGCYDPALEYAAAEVVKCMQDFPAKDLANIVGQYQLQEYNEGRLGFGPVTPTIQKVTPRGSEKFIAEDPAIVLENKTEAQVPFMAGSTRHDGSHVLGMVYKLFIEKNNLVNNQTFLKTQLIPQVLTAMGIEDTDGEVFDVIANTYLGLEVKNSGNFTAMLPGLTDMISVLYFKSASFRALKLHSRLESQSYWYNFDYRGLQSMYSSITDVRDNPVQGGVSHGDDLIYIFSIPYLDLNDPDDLAVSQRMVNYWINFAETGNPNTGESQSFDKFSSETNIPKAETWPVFSEETPYFAILGTEDAFVAENPNDYWIGASQELYPEPTMDTTTEGGESTTNAGEDSTTSAGEDSTTNAGENSTTNAREEGTTDIGDGNRTSTWESTPFEGNEPTTPGLSPIPQQWSLLLFFVVIVNCIIQGMR